MSRSLASRSSSLSILGLLLLPIGSHAISNNAGTRNGDFLNLATDARGVVLNDSSVSSVDGVNALRWNPAALSSLAVKDFSGTHTEYYQTVRIENVGFAYPFGEESGAVAVSAFYLSAGDLDGRDTFGTPTGNFKFYDAVGTIGYGRKLLTRNEGLDLSFGINLKVVQEKIADQSYQNPALDIGFLSVPIDNLQVGLTGRNLSSSKANFAREVVAGASYAFLNKTLVPAFAVNYSNNAPLRLSVSSEYRIQELDGAALRVGYRTHDTLDNSLDSKVTFLRSGGIAGVTLGAGVNLRPPSMQSLLLGIDYGMAPFGALGISHTVTVSARW